MKSYRQYVDDNYLKENVIRKGAVAIYASQSRRHGDLAATAYAKAKAELNRSQDAKNTDQKLEYLTSALLQVIEGLIATRQQIGSVSAQITASELLTQK